MRTIKEWQRDAYALAVEKGFHDCRACQGGKLAANNREHEYELCSTCCGSGRVDPHSPTRISSRLALIHCEISEAVECVARGQMGLYWSGPTSNFTSEQAGYPERDIADIASRGFKPEGFPVELADVFIRLCDLAESLGLTIAYDFDKRHTYAPLSGAENIAAALADLHWEVGGILGLKDHPEILDGALSWFMRALHQIANSTGVDLLAMAELKHEYNKTRPIMHGGKVL